MRILAIETSCDETAIALLECAGDDVRASFRTLGNALLSQIDIHKEYGGVFPALAKREHAKNLVPVLAAALEEAELLHESAQALPEELHEKLSVLLEREPGLGEALLAFLASSEPPAIDAIAVTYGPGLEPALWVGVNFAKALALAWNKPLIGVNHMEGHMLSALAAPQEDTLAIEDVTLPVAGLLISGGHTEIVSMREWLSYELEGSTRDDAVGEAFDKVARMLDLPYPGGPEISKLAEASRTLVRERLLELPRPMMNDATCDFSFSGLKTAVMYELKKMPALDIAQKEAIAEEFENAVADVLWTKTSRALARTGARALVIGGGVSGNIHIRRVFEERIALEHPEVTLRIPPHALTTDNAVMIGIAAYYRALRGEYADIEALRANGNLSLA
ncbi:MAG TPA: tRNA (adenosine(37)-N6)-threonylcarbamoyltransferase complex transferase subunit TsaD [Candidatus Paceibacterota bacterium]|nr:tRNA (adenosine(37)-N6)-threonylcarbamoyltransferase complex transferase subunit TsaD [Candidatus Paceibacterota bacterium]